MPSPKTLAGKAASASAERPTTNNASVSSAVRNGDEKAENSSAIVVTTDTSHTASNADAAITRRSSGATPDNHNPSTNKVSAQRNGSQVRARGRRHASSASSTTLPNKMLATRVGELPAMPDIDSNSTPEFAATKTVSVS